ncbi:hypothetical protein RJ639_042287 [Escallonia herrerae]|uniref:Uncharacterized protein n=1 Tax=Escallonia herrerae TaxID=1293975 RepID=A0AA89B4T7_9ASTE|nr:hypothetical protein RJ639_042287 [Escallonia herrerae]
MERKEVMPRLKKGFWQPEEDLILKKYVETHGEGNWTKVSQRYLIHISWESVFRISGIAHFRSSGSKALTV